MKDAVEARPILKTYAFFSCSNTDPEITENLLIREGMNRIDLLNNAHASIQNKMDLIARAIWYVVTPVTQNVNGVNQPKVFCCLFHNG